MQIVSHCNKLSFEEVVFLLLFFFSFDFAPFNKSGAERPRQHSHLLWSQK